MDYFFKMQGDGDMGEKITLDDGLELNRLSGVRETIFGEHRLQKNHPHLSVVQAVQWSLVA
jgi:hypothetical protein